MSTTNHTKSEAEAIRDSIAPLLKVGEKVSIRAFGFAATDAEAAALPWEVTVSVQMSHGGRPTNPVNTGITSGDIKSIKVALKAVRDAAKAQKARTTAAYAYAR
mgnify:FL=1